jgi:hypothetical protein
VSLLTVAELKAQVRSSLSDAQLQSVIDREEAEVIRLYGAHYVGISTTVTETLEGGTRSLYLRRRLTSVSSITEYSTSDSITGTALTAVTDYRVWAAQGRIERMPSTNVSGFGVGVWGAIVTIVYVPADDNDLRRAAIIDLCRLALERTALKSENVAGEYSYTAPEWGQARAEILQRLGFVNV